MWTPIGRDVHEPVDEPVDNVPFLGAKRPASVDILGTVETGEIA
jgi:hypothetical protein